MILTFSTDAFKERIMAGTKIHSIRLDPSERWKKGTVIHFWRGNPRNTQSTPKPHQFHELGCTSVQKIQVFYTEDDPRIVIDGRDLDPEEFETLAKNDGFDSVQDFFNFFNENFKGKLVHWTSFKY